MDGKRHLDIGDPDLDKHPVIEAAALKCVLVMDTEGQVARRWLIFGSNLVCHKPMIRT